MRGRVWQDRYQNKLPSWRSTAIDFQFEKACSEKIWKDVWSKLPCLLHCGTMCIFQKILSSLSDYEQKGWLKIAQLIWLSNRVVYRIGQMLLLWLLCCNMAVYIWRLTAPGGSMPSLRLIALVVNLRTTLRFLASKDILIVPIWFQKQNGCMRII